MAKVVVMDHPLIQHKIGVIRRKETGSRDFRAMIGEIASLITYEATKDLKLQDVEIETPICKTTAKELAGKKMAIVPILRAGLGMVDGMLAMIPSAKVGHRWSRWSITASFRQTAASAMCLWSIPCWRREAPLWRLSTC